MRGWATTCRASTAPAADKRTPKMPGSAPTAGSRWRVAGASLVRAHRRSLSAVPGRPWRSCAGRGMRAAPGRAYLGIGAVLALLRAEFPDVSVSKIRFLEHEGLIQPARSPSRYRKFAPADVERLRYILTAQRDQYLPLRVIKDQLDAVEEDGYGEPGRYPAPAGRPAGPAHPAGPLTRRELLEATGLEEAQLAELEDFGLVRRSGRHYGPDALA